ncbi:MAG: hypothetical protein AAF547_16520 [Actinomycetota bacterium]
MPGIDPSKLDPDLGPDPGLGLEQPTRAATATKTQTSALTPPGQSDPATTTESPVPTLRVVEDLDPEDYDPDPEPFDIDQEETDTFGDGRVGGPADAIAADVDDDLDDDDDEFAGDFDPALAPPPGYRQPD